MVSSGRPWLLQHPGQAAHVGTVGYSPFTLAGLGRPATKGEIMLLVILAKGFTDDADGAEWPESKPVGYWTGAERYAAVLVQALRDEFRETAPSLVFSFEDVKDAARFTSLVSQLGCGRSGGYGEVVLAVCDAAMRQAKWLKAREKDRLGPPPFTEKSDAPDGKQVAADESAGTPAAADRAEIPPQQEADGKRPCLTRDSELEEFVTAAEEKKKRTGGHGQGMSTTRTTPTPDCPMAGPGAIL